MHSYRVITLSIFASASLALSACTGRGEVRMTATAPGLATGNSYALLPPSDPGAALAVPMVERELARLGWRADPASPVQLIVGGGTRSLGVGAYTSLDCARAQWAAVPRRKRLLGGGNIATLTLLFVDRASAAPLYRVTSSRRQKGADFANVANALARDALTVDPRTVATSPASPC